MKKSLLTIAGLSATLGLCANEATNQSDWQSKITVDSKVAFKTEHVTRGRREMKKVFAPSLEIGYGVFDSARAYVGADVILALENSKGNEVAPYFGMYYDISDMFTVDAGYIRHFYTSADKSIGAAKRDTNEIFVGVMADVAALPSLYCFYDFDRREAALEGVISHSFDLSDHSISGLGIDIGAKLGYDKSKKPLGQKYVDAMGKKAYFYYGVNADVVYSLNSNAKAKLGVAYEGNSAKKNSWTNASGNGHKNSIWFNASVDCSF